MRKAKNITKRVYLNIMGWCFVIVMVFVAFIFGVIIGEVSGADVVCKECSKESQNEKRVNNDTF